MKLAIIEKTIHYPDSKENSYIRYKAMFGSVKIFEGSFDNSGTLLSIEKNIKISDVKDAMTAIESYLEENK